MPNNALFITTYASFGDILYQTPFIRWLKGIFDNVDVWCRNHEPLLNNPNIRYLFKLDSFSIPDPFDFYWGNVFKVNRAEGSRLRTLPQSNIHTVDYFTIGAHNFTLRDKEKDLEFQWTKEDEVHVRKLLDRYDLVSNESKGANFTVMCPGITWPSRTLPLEFYQHLIGKIQASGDKIILVGKDVNYKDFDPNREKSDERYDKFMLKETKQFYSPIDLPKRTINLINKLTFGQLAALYSFTKVAVNSENGNMVVSCTNDKCWNLYIPTLTPPEFRLPYRHGDKYFKTVVVGNDENWYPATNYKPSPWSSLEFAESKIPSVEKVFENYQKACEGFKHGKERI